MDKPTWWTPTLIFIGIILLLWTKRREFRRTNQYGIQHYSSYWHKLRAEGVDAVLTGLGYLSMATGAGLFIFGDNSVASWIALAALVWYLSLRRQPKRD